jgi:hypothetical protein
MYDLSKLSEEEKEQLKDYVNAVKETKKAIKELLEKTKPVVKNEAKSKNWGGPRKNLVMTLEKDEE